MRLFFSTLSIGYVVGIFILADSPMVSDLARFNPYSLLHVPLYGILTFLLIFSLVPITHSSNNPLTQSSNDSVTKLPHNFKTRFLVIGFIAVGVAIADEIHQAYVPGRDASVTDMLLDTLGISLVLFIIFQRYKKTTQQHNDPTVSTI